MTLGEKLAKLRKEHHFTQEQLAQILGVSRQAVSKWESNLTYPETEYYSNLGNCIIVRWTIF
ncbi:helix-turn-helix domain-containing protein [Fervidibacillus albus]|uniref:Helix-turn-helix domain-containing protein n=1 Tax=Fervidibacillus albus TaxID=2980026 RepID=A0A9E8RWZ5_9BACI|nr:helix-turn-helix transcriptional regulator [Fervidibacillus albus]WAA08972.1 helix-turn-helix domain-containing protein [Fervidibacillus albus]